MENIKNLGKICISTILSPVSILNKIKQSPLLEKRELFMKAYTEGIYHFTTKEAANKIISSEMVKKSGIIKSYSLHKKSFFFAGIPDIEKLILNGLNPTSEIVAVRIKLSYEELAKFEYRSANDEALSYNGDYHFDAKDAEIVNLKLIYENNKIIYRPLDELKKDYDINNNKNITKKFASNLKRCQIGLLEEYKYIKKRLSLFDISLQQVSDDIKKR